MIEMKINWKLSNQYETIRGMFFLTAGGYSCNHAEWNTKKIEGYQYQPNPFMYTLKVVQLIPQPKYGNI